MAGFLICMLRVLRLKKPLQSTVTSPEFAQLNAFGDLAKVIMDEDMWVWLFLMTRGVYAMMRILRLADQKTAAMDKLFFYIKQADRVAPLYLAQAETYRNKLTINVLSVMSSTDDLASQMLDNDDEEEEMELEAEEQENNGVENDWEDSMSEGEGNEEEGKEEEVSSVI
jgi:hypothetical protein